jgi:hypothetical protein
MVAVKYSSGPTKRYVVAEPTAVVNGASAAEQAATLPTNTPVTLTSPLPAVALLNNWQLAHNSSGVDGIQRSQASSTDAAAPQGHSSVKSVIAAGIG